MSPGPASTERQAPLDAGWRLALGSLAWLGGVAAQLQQPALWTLVAYQVLLLAALALAGLAWRLRPCPRGVAGFALVWLALGLALAGFGSTGWRAT